MYVGPQETELFRPRRFVTVCTFLQNFQKETVPQVIKCDSKRHFLFHAFSERKQNLSFVIALFFQSGFKFSNVS